MVLEKVINLLKGGEGSGNFGHAGRPGEVGGSTKEGIGGTGGESSQPKKIKRIISVEDTRQYEEGPDDKFHPIPGSGTAHECSRCGKEHEIHWTVELEGGGTEVVGGSCAKSLFVNDRDKINIEGSVKSLARNKAELKFHEEQYSIRERAEKEAAMLPHPQIEAALEHYKDGTPYVEFRMGDAFTWVHGSNVTASEDIKNSLSGDWEMKRADELAKKYGSKKPDRRLYNWKDLISYNKKSIDKIVAKIEQKKKDLERKETTKNTIGKILTILKGGPGSGNYGHRGRPGIRGGSAKEGEGGSVELEGGLSRAKIQKYEKMGRESIRKSIDALAAQDQLSPESYKKDIRAGWIEGRKVDSYSAHSLRDLTVNKTYEMINNNYGAPYANAYRSIGNEWGGSANGSYQDYYKYVYAKETGGTVYTYKETVFSDVTKDSDYEARVNSYVYNNEGGPKVDFDHAKMREAIKAGEAFNRGIMKELFGDEITLYRGIARKEAPKADRIGGEVDVNMNSVSSWTSSKKIAYNFSSADIPNIPNKRVYKITVPISRIAQSGLSGFGTLGEREFLLKGGPMKVQWICCEW